MDEISKVLKYARTKGVTVNAACKALGTTPSVRMKVYKYRKRQQAAKREFTIVKPESPEVLFEPRNEANAAKTDEAWTGSEIDFAISNLQTKLDTLRAARTIMASSLRSTQ